MPRKNASARGYGRAWFKLRARHLRREPWCRMCAAQGIRTKAEHVDHIRPHRGDDRLLMDPLNLQSLCVPHHNSDKQQQERKGYSSRVGGDGLPLDSRHPFNT